MHYYEFDIKYVVYVVIPDSVLAKIVLQLEALKEARPSYRFPRADNCSRDKL